MEQHVRPGRCPRTHRCVLSIDIKIFQSKNELPTSRHGIARVQGDIEQDLMELRWIAFDRPKVFRIIARYLDRFWKCSLRNIDHLVNEMAWLDQNALALDPSRKCEHLLNYARPALRAFLYEQEGRFPIFRVQSVAQSLRANQNGRENIVQIVRHAASKGADAFEALGTEQLHLEF